MRRALLGERRIAEDDEEYMFDSDTPFDEPENVKNHEY